MPRRLFVLAALALPLAGCGGAAPRGAAESASRLIAAALKDDRAAFEAQIDRKAVREDLRRQVAAVARTDALEVDGGPSEFALDRMIGPQALTVIAAGSGRTPAAPPSASAVAAQMKMIDDKRACVRAAPSGGDCVLTFARADRGWRLVGMKAMGARLEVSEAGD